MKNIFLKIGIFCLLFFMINIVHGQNIPKNAIEYLPLLNKVIDETWPDLSMRSLTASQVEQETCISLTHSKCWNPKAELKTSREYGFGFGQITITDKFNNFEEIKKMDKSLIDWKWEDRYNPYRQLKALIVYDKFIYNKVIGAHSDYDRLAFTLAAYNGGLGGLTQDRQLCKLQNNCDSSKWFSNVEKTSNKSKVKSSGYGKSFFEINREYVSNILLVRRNKYIDIMEKKPEPEPKVEMKIVELKIIEEIPIIEKSEISCHWIDRLLRRCLD